MSEANNGNTNPTPPPGKKLRKPVAELRAEILADPDVQEQARILNMPLEQYAEKILDYALNPDKGPQLQITPDEELKAKNPKVPTVEEVQEYLEKINSGEIVISPAHQRDGFDRHTRPKGPVEINSPQPPSKDPSNKV